MNEVARLAMLRQQRERIAGRMEAYQWRNGPLHEYQMQYFAGASPDCVALHLDRSIDLAELEKRAPAAYQMPLANGVVSQRLYKINPSSGKTYLVATWRPGDTRWVSIEERPE